MTSYLQSRDLRGAAPVLQQHAAKHTPRTPRPPAIPRAPLHPLLRQMNTQGAPSTAAKLSAAWKSPSLLAPSPKYATATFWTPLSCQPGREAGKGGGRGWEAPRGQPGPPPPTFRAQAVPTACGSCAASSALHKAPLHQRMCNPPHLEGVGRPDRVRQLRRERRRDGVVRELGAAIVDGHLAPLARLQLVAVALVRGGECARGACSTRVRGKAVRAVALSGARGGGGWWSRGGGLAGLGRWGAPAWHTS